MLFRLGTVTFADEANGVTVEDHEMPDRTRIAYETAPRRHGAIVTEEPVLEQRVFTFRGRTKKASEAALRTWIDDTLKAINIADINFYLYDTTRFIVCSKQDFNWSLVPGTAGVSLEYECELFAKDPFWYRDTLTTDTQTASNWPTSALTWTHTNPGSVLMYPIYTITNNIGSGSISGFTLTNTTTGKSWTFSGSVANGKAYVFDTALFTSKNDGTSDLNSLTGVPVWVVSGANSMSFSGANATVKVEYRPRFFGP